MMGQFLFPRFLTKESESAAKCKFFDREMTIE